MKTMIPVGPTLFAPASAVIAPMMLVAKQNSDLATLAGVRNQESLYHEIFDLQFSNSGDVHVALNPQISVESGCHRWGSSCQHLFSVPIDSIFSRLHTLASSDSSVADLDDRPFLLGTPSFQNGSLQLASAKVTRAVIGQFYPSQTDSKAEEEKKMHSNSHYKGKKIQS